MSDIREGVQEDAKKAYLDLPGARRATIIAGTGAGKSKIAIDIIKALNPVDILLLTNSENLRDNNWFEEFKKFGALEYWFRVKSECYQTVHRWKDTHYSLVIADEIDFAMSPVYSQYFKNNSWHNLLGLTGFCTKEKRELLNEIAPICFEVSTQDMQEQGLLNKSEFIFVEYDLDVTRNIKIPKNAGGHFFTSENDQYKYYDTEFTKSIIIKSGAEKSFNLMSTPENESKFKNADFKFKMMAAKRKSILNSLDSSIKVVNSLVTKIGANPDNKVVVYSALTKQADKTQLVTYHGDDDDEVLGALNVGEVRALAVCKKLNRGINLIGVNYLIKESFDGSETDFQQQHGRLMRLRPDQTAKIIVLVPYFRALVKTEEKDLLGRTHIITKMQRLPTQAKKWAEKMMMSFDNINGRTIVMRKDYKLPEGAVL